MEGSLPSPRLDRKIVEKKRRLHMKSLCSELDSLIPSSPRLKESLPLHERLGEAVKYIEVLKLRLEKMKERKAGLLGGEATIRGESSGSRPPQIEVQDLSSGLRLFLISSPSDASIFYAAVRILEEEGSEVVAANVSLVGDRALHSIHSLVGDAQGDPGTGKVVERLKKCLHAVNNAP